MHRHAIDLHISIYTNDLSIWERRQDILGTVARSVAREEGSNKICQNLVGWAENGTEFLNGRGDILDYEMPPRQREHQVCSTGCKRQTIK